MRKRKEGRRGRSEVNNNKYCWLFARYFCDNVRTVCCKKTKNTKLWSGWLFFIGDFPQRAILRLTHIKHYYKFLFKNVNWITKAFMSTLLRKRKMFCTTNLNSRGPSPNSTLCWKNPLWENLQISFLHLPSIQLAVKSALWIWPE